MFDPYRKWLGIPSQQRPPTYYQLLGVAPEEIDREVIEEAALMRTAHVRNFQTGPHAEACQQILDEIALACETLLNPERRQTYDRQLERSAAKASASTPPPKPSPPAEPSLPPPALQPQAAPTPKPMTAATAAPPVVRGPARSLLGVWIVLALISVSILGGTWLALRPRAPTPLPVADESPRDAGSEAAKDAAASPETAIADWQAQAKAMRAALPTGGSEAILAAATWDSSTALRTQLAQARGDAQVRLEPSLQKLATLLEPLERQRKERQQTVQPRQEELAKLKQLAPPPAAAIAALEAEVQAVQRFGERIDALSAELTELRRLVAAIIFEDPPAQALLAALDEIEQCVAAPLRRPLGAGAAAKAAELFSSGPPALRQLALHALVRQGQPAAIAAAAAEVRNVTADPAETARLCWSLLLSGQPAGIDAAAFRVNTPQGREIVGRFPHAALLSLMETAPATFHRLLGPLAEVLGSDPQGALAVFRVQCSLREPAGLADLLPRCTNPQALQPMRAQVIAAVFNAQWKEAFPKVRALLEADRALPLDGMDPALLTSAVTAAPDLEGLLAAHLLANGTRAQVEWAIPRVCAPQTAADLNDVRARLKQKTALPPAELFSLLAARPESESHSLAEWVLHNLPFSETASIAFADIHPKALERSDLKRTLFELLWTREPARARPWVTEKLLGQPFVDTLRALAAAVPELVQIVQTAGSFFDAVVLNRVGDAKTPEYGVPLQLTQAPSADIERWTAGAARVSTETAALQSALAQVRTGAPAYFQPSINDLDRYLVEVALLARNGAELAKLLRHSADAAKADARKKTGARESFRYVPKVTAEAGKREVAEGRKLVGRLQDQAMIAPVAALFPGAISAAPSVAPSSRATTPAPVAKPKKAKKKKR